MQDPSLLYPDVKIWFRLEVLYYYKRAAPRGKITKFSNELLTQDGQREKGEYQCFREQQLARFLSRSFPALKRCVHIK